MMLALIEDEDKLAMNVMQRTQADVEVFEKGIRQKASRLPTQNPAPEDINFARSSTTVLKKAQELMKEQGDSFTAVDHLFLALCQNPDIAAILKDANVSYKMIEEVVKNIRGGRKVDSESAEGISPLFLSHLFSDLRGFEQVRNGPYRICQKRPTGSCHWP